MAIPTVQVGDRRLACFYSLCDSHVYVFLSLAHSKLQNNTTTFKAGLKRKQGKAAMGTYYLSQALAGCDFSCHEVNCLPL